MDDKKLDDLVRAEIVSREEFERANSDGGKGFSDGADKRNLKDVVSDSFRFGSAPYFINFFLSFGMGFIFENSKEVPSEYNISILDHSLTFLSAALGMTFVIDLIPTIRKINKFIYQSKANYLYGKVYFVGGALAGALFAYHLK